MTFAGGEVWRIDPETYTRVGPTTPVTGDPVSASATRHGERLVVSGWSDGPKIDLYDGNTGEHPAGPVDGAYWSQVSLDGTIVGALGVTITEFGLGADRGSEMPEVVFVGAVDLMPNLLVLADGEVNGRAFPDRFAKGACLLIGEALVVNQHALDLIEEVVRDAEVKQAFATLESTRSARRTG